MLSFNTFIRIHIFIYNIIYIKTPMKFFIKYFSYIRLFIFILNNAID
jgi:hypothetical protein